MICIGIPRMPRMSPTDDPLDLSGQESSRKQRELSDRERQRRDAEDLKWVMADARGRRVVWKHLEGAMVFVSTFNTSGSITAFNEGKRASGLQLMEVIMAVCPERFFQMLKEHKSND